MRMSDDMLLRYAQSAMPPGERARLFVTQDPRLQWVNDVFDASDDAEVTFGGPTLRTVLLGSLPKHLVVNVDGISTKRLRSALAEHGDVHLEGARSTGSGQDESVVTFQPTKAPGMSITVTEAPHERQDFTVDSLRYRARGGEMEDPTGKGLDDLHARRIRVHGYPLRVFANDPLRTLRALRLAAEHRLTFSDETWHALTRSLPRLQSVVRNANGAPQYAYPRQAIGATLLEILLAEPRYGAALIHASGLGGLVAPESSDHAWQQAAQAMHMLVHDDTLRGHGIDKHRAATIVAGLLAFQPDASSLATRLVRNLYLHQFPEGHAAHLDVGDVEWLLGNVRMFDEVDPASLQPSAFEKVFGNARGRSLLALMQSLFLTEGRHHIARERLHVARRLLEALDERRPGLQKLLRGRDLETLGIPPGPLYRRLMAKVRDAQLAGSVATRDDAMQFLRLELARM